MKKYLFPFIFLFSVLFSPLWVNAQKKHQTFKDTLDHAFDVSYYLKTLHGFLPLVSPITEPAVGYGAAGGGLFFITKKAKVNEHQFRMPDIAGVFGGYTANGTWFTGGGYFGFWKKDHIRYRGVFGYGDIKLKYYGEGNDFLDKHPVTFRIKSYFFLQQMIFRLGDSPFFLGGKFQWMKNTVVLFDNSEIPGINPIDLDATNGGLGIIAEYESYNNLFSPSRGIRMNLTYDQYLKFLGSDRDFGKITFFACYYQPVIAQHWTAGFRFESQWATGDPPFYMKPFIQLRGIPAMRYQNDLTALIETEQEVAINRRWSILAFGGYGKAFSSYKTFSEGVNAWNAGTGFRYLIARLFGMKMGMDVARGPEQWAVYVVVGNAWIR